MLKSATEAKLRPLFEVAVEKKVTGIGTFVIDSKDNFVLKETFGTNNLQDPSVAPLDADTTF